MQYMHALETYINKNAWDAYEGLLNENTTITIKQIPNMDKI